MSNIDINLTSKSEEDLIAELKNRQEARRDLKAKLVTVLDRGLVGDRLHVELPNDKYGEWVPDDKLEIYRMESMGFKVDSEYASKRALHDSGSDGTSKVADVVFMVCEREIYDIIQEIKAEQYDAINTPRGGKQKEERDFMAETESVGLPSKMHSRIDPATVDSIRDALTAKD